MVVLPGSEVESCEGDSCPGSSLCPALSGLCTLLPKILREEKVKEKTMLSKHLRPRPNCSSPVAGGGSSN